MAIRYLSGINVDSNTLFVDSTNNRVGIGTASPSYSLDIDGRLRVSAGGNEIAAFMKTTSSFGAVISYQDATTPGSQFVSAGAYGNNFIVSTNGQLQLIVNSSGNVGIGTTSPNSYLSGTSGLSVYNNDYPAVGFANTSAYWLWYMSGSTLRMWNSVNSETIVAHTSGNVTIGSSSVDAGFKLDVAGQARFGSGAKAIVGTDGTYGGYSTIGFGGTTNGYNRVFGYDGTGDGLYLTAATGQGMAFWTNGSSQRMFITAAGNVLIGTQVDYSRLTVSSGSSTRSGITISDANTASLMLFAGASAPASISFDTFGLRFVGGSTVGTDNGSEFMRITTAGNVGIGTTSPREKFQVTGNTVIGSAGLNSYKTNLYLTYSAGADETWFRIYVPQDYVSSNNGGTIKVRVLWEGDHATFGAYQEYQISYKTYYPASPYLTFSNVLCTNKTSDFNTGSTYYGPSSTPDVNFYTAGDSYLYVLVKGYQAAYNTARYIEAEIFGRTTAQPTIGTTTAPGSPSLIPKTIQFLPQEGNIYASGSIGIGTTSPGSRLEISGATGSYNSGIGFVPSGTGARNYRTYIATDGSFNFDDATAGATRINLSSTGNVGIGTTSPAAKLEVVGDAKFGGTSNYNSITINNNSNTGGGGILLQRNGVNNAYIGALGWYQGTSNSGAVIGTDNSSYPIVFYTNVERMRITGGGNVGIGTDSPSQNLHVAGNVRVTGSYYDSNNEAGTSGQVLTSTGSGTDWVTPATTTAASLYDLLPAARVAYNWTGQVVNDTWVDIFSAADNVLTTGTWIVQMYISDFAVGGGHYTYTYTGTMQWYQATVNQAGEAAASEIYLHRMGHAANASALYLRTTEMTAVSGGIGKLQIKGNYSNTSNTTINFKFVKIF